MNEKQRRELSKIVLSTNRLQLEVEKIRRKHKAAPAENKYQRDTTNKLLEYSDAVAALLRLYVAFNLLNVDAHRAGEVMKSVGEAAKAIEEALIKEGDGQATTIDPHNYAPDEGSIQPCPECGGTGLDEDTHERTAECERCNGTGAWVIKRDE